jgi:type IV secretion system protein VirD4
MINSLKNIKINDFFNNKKPLWHYGLMGALIFCGIFVIMWVWGLLLNLFYPLDSFATPLTAPLLFLHYSSNPARLNFLLGITLLVPSALVLASIFSHHRHKKFSSIYGDAHFATLSEIKKMGLLKNTGLVLGEFKNTILRITLISHVLIFAPSRSGKGVSQVMPNALLFPDSMLIIDLKDEIFKDTSGFRCKHEQEIYRFAPADKEGRTHCHNPLDLVSRHDARMISDIQLVTEILIYEIKGDNDNMWILEARSLAQGLLLWLINSDRPFTLGELSAIVKGTPHFVDFLRNLLEESLDDKGNLKIHPIAFQNINNFVQKAPKEQSGVKSTLTSRLSLWDDPLINAATSRSDFDIRDMRRKRMTVYLSIPINQKDRLAPLMNLFIQLFLNAMTEELPKPDEKYKVLLMLDEFCALGYMRKVKDGFSYLAGYNIHLMAIIQNIGQFYELYGHDGSDVFFQNTDYKIVYRQNTKTDQEFVSNQLGTRTIKIRSQNFHSNPMTRKHTNIGESHIARPLLSPEEVRRFPKKEGIAIINGQPPIRFKRIIHYQDKNFKDRILKPIKIEAITPFYPKLNINKKLLEEAERKPATDPTNQFAAALMNFAQSMAGGKEKESPTLEIKNLPVGFEGDIKITD